jgi:4-hydroxybenzoate polyprenyltransferase
LLFSNILVSLCAALMVSLTQMLLLAPNGIYLEVFTFCATLAVYNFQRIFPFIYGEINQGLSQRQQWILKHLSPLILMSSFSLFLASIIFLFKIDQKLIVGLTLFPLFLLSFWYAVDLGRVFKFPKTKYKKLRMVPYLKIFLIGLTWSVVTIGLPVFEARENLFSLDVWWLFLERILFLFAIILPFDIRDMKQDERYQLLTIPNKIGISSTINLSLGLLMAFAILSLIRIWILPHTAFAAFPLFISAIITAVIVRKAHPDKSEYYFSGLVESTMIMQFLLVYLAWIIH